MEWHLAWSSTNATALPANACSAWSSTLQCLQTHANRRHIPTLLTCRQLRLPAPAAGSNSRPHE
eukprot:scaffold153074_cov15-Tisochrysis_lutea.AAC.1